MANRAEAAAWSVRMEGYGGPAQPSPTIEQCLNGGLGWLEVECPHCKTRASLPLDAIRRPRNTPLWKLEASLKGRKADSRHLEEAACSMLTGARAQPMREWTSCRTRTLLQSAVFIPPMKRASRSAHDISRFTHRPSYRGGHDPRQLWRQHPSLSRAPDCSANRPTKHDCLGKLARSGAPMLGAEGTQPPELYIRVSHI